MAEACSAALQAPRASYLKSGSRRRGSNSRDKTTGGWQTTMHTVRETQTDTTAVLATAQPAKGKMAIDGFFSMPLVHVQWSLRLYIVDKVK